MAVYCLIWPRSGNVSNKEEYKKRLTYFERLGFLIEIDKFSIKMDFQPKLY